MLYLVNYLDKIENMKKIAVLQEREKAIKLAEQQGSYVNEWQDGKAKTIYKASKINYELLSII